MDKRYYDEAGLVFSRCEEYEKALMAYKESLNWQSMLYVAMELSYPDDKIISLCIEVAGLYYFLLYIILSSYVCSLLI